MNRRDLLTGMGGLATIGIGAQQVRDWNERSLRARVFIARASSYQADLESIIDDGLHALGLSASWAKGRSVLLKPNLVEPCHDAPQVNTHPHVVRAAALAFRRWGRAKFWSAKDRAIAAMHSSCSTSLAWGPSSMTPGSSSLT